MGCPCRLAPALTDRACRSLSATSEVALAIASLPPLCPCRACPSRAPVVPLWCPWDALRCPRPWVLLAWPHRMPSRAIWSTSQLRPTRSSERIRLIDQPCSTYRHSR
jgi:hypothetical protein